MSRSTETLLDSLVAGLDNAPDLSAAINGHTYATRASEVWNLPGSLSFPILAVSLEQHRDPVRGDSSASGHLSATVKMYYVTNGTILEALLFRDALKTKLHLQQQPLSSLGINVTWIELVSSRVSMLADLTKHQAYLEFEVVV